MPGSLSLSPHACFSVLALSVTAQESPYPKLRSAARIQTQFYLISKQKGRHQNKEVVTKHGPCWLPFHLCSSRLYCSANIRLPSPLRDVGSGHSSCFGWWNLSRHDASGRFRCHCITLLSSWYPVFHQEEHKNISPVLIGPEWEITQRLEFNIVWGPIQPSPGSSGGNPQILKQEKVFVLRNTDLGVCLKPDQ